MQMTFGSFLFNKTEDFSEKGGGAFEIWTFFVCVRDLDFWKVYKPWDIFLNFFLHLLDNDSMHVKQKYFILPNEYNFQENFSTGNFGPKMGNFYLQNAAVSTNKHLQSWNLACDVLSTWSSFSRILNKIYWVVLIFLNKSN